MDTGSVVYILKTDPDRTSADWRIKLRILVGLFYLAQDMRSETRHSAFVRGRFSCLLKLQKVQAVRKFSCNDAPQLLFRSSAFTQMRELFSTCWSMHVLICWTRACCNIIRTSSVKGVWEEEPDMFLFWSGDSIIAAKVKPPEDWLLTVWWD